MKKLLIVLIILGIFNFAGCSLKNTEPKTESETSTAISSSEESLNTVQSDSKVSTESASEQLGYVKKLYKENDATFASIQYVQWLSGDEAIKAIMEDKKCTKEEAQSEFTDDHYIRYKKEVSAVKVSNTATYSIIKTGVEATDSTFDEVTNALKEAPGGILYDITLKNNEITNLKQRYQP